MSRINVGIELAMSSKDFERAINKALRDKVLRTFTRSKNNILKRMRETIKESVFSQPEYQSLMGGKLQGELGVNNPQQRVDNIIDTWLSSLKVITKNPRMVGGSLTGSFRVTMGREDFSDLISLDDARILTDKGDVLQWLEALLLWGAQIIVREYKVSTRLTPRSRSRTGLAIMVRDVGGRWSVPAEFQGTKTRNWLTRSLSTVKTDIERIISKEIKANFK